MTRGLGEKLSFRGALFDLPQYLIHLTKPFQFWFSVTYGKSYQSNFYYIYGFFQERIYMGGTLTLLYFRLWFKGQIKQQFFHVSSHFTFASNCIHYFSKLGKISKHLQVLLGKEERKGGEKMLYLVILVLECSSLDWKCQNELKIIIVSTAKQRVFKIHVIQSIFLMHYIYALLPLSFQT